MDLVGIYALRKKKLKSRLHTIILEEEPTVTFTKSVSNNLRLFNRIRTFIHVVLRLDLLHSFAADGTSSGHGRVFLNDVEGHLATKNDPKRGCVLPNDYVGNG